MTLDGRGIVVTRAPHQSGELSYLIEQAGGIPIMYPCIDIRLPDDTSQLDSALLNLKTYDWVIFTSSNTVYALVSHIKNAGLSVDWSAIKIACVGTKTADTVREQLGRDVNFVPQTHTGATLASGIPVKSGDTVLLPQSDFADDSLFKALTIRDAKVRSIDVYLNVIGRGGEDVPALLKQNKIDAITFTSGSSVINFIKRIAPMTAFEIPITCIGSSSYRVAIEAGFQQVQYPDNYTIPDMLERLTRLFDKEK